MIPVRPTRFLTRYGAAQRRNVSKRPRFPVDYDPSSPPVPVIRYLNNGDLDLDSVPLEVLIDNMRHFMKQARTSPNEEVETSYRMRAVAVAKEAAPYVHAKLATTTIKGDAENPLVVESKVVDERKRPEQFLLEWMAREAVSDPAAD